MFLHRANLSLLAMEWKFLHQIVSFWLRCFLSTWSRHWRPMSSPLWPHRSCFIRYLGCAYRAHHLLLLYQQGFTTQQPPYSTSSFSMVSGLLVSPRYRLHLPSARFPSQAPNTGCIEGFFRAENCNKNMMKSINTTSLFYISKNVIKFKLFQRSWLTQQEKIEFNYTFSEYKIG